MYCGSLFVWGGGGTMEEPPTFVAGSGCREGAGWGMKQIPPCSLRSLVGMIKILGDGRLSKFQGFWVVLTRGNGKVFGFVRVSCVLDRGVL